MPLFFIHPLMSRVRIVGWEEQKEFSIVHALGKLNYGLKLEENGKSLARLAEKLLLFLIYSNYARHEI